VAFLPPDLIDFVFEPLSEPLGVWDELRPIDLIGSDQLEFFFDGDLISRPGSQKATNGLLDS
jgi:hypothetical protein